MQRFVCFFHDLQQALSTFQKLFLHARTRLDVQAGNFGSALHCMVLCSQNLTKTLLSHAKSYALITSHYVHYIPLHIITQSFASISHSKMEECWVESLSDHFLTDSTECQTSLRFERTGVATRLASAVCDTFPLLQQPHGNIDE